MTSEKKFDKVKTDKVIIHRPEKGLIMKFSPNFVIKDLSSKPIHPLISREEQTRRLKNEIMAYKRLNSLKCPFVPDLIDYSLEQRFITISRIYGINLLELLQNTHNWLSPNLILRQIDQMNYWLRHNNFGKTETKLKDLILEQNNKLFLVDFEQYSANLQNKKKYDMYNIIIYDILERILIRTVRTVKLTTQFILFTIILFLKKPFKFIRLAVRCLINEGKNSWWFISFDKKLKRDK
jgi:tRNA A-37 threonylcarbamoyl transferase component Bud32